MSFIEEKRWRHSARASCHAVCAFLTDRWPLGDGWVKGEVESRQESFTVYFSSKFLSPSPSELINQKEKQTALATAPTHCNLIKFPDLASRSPGPYEGWTSKENSGSSGKENPAELSVCLMAAGSAFHRVSNSSRAIRTRSASRVAKAVVPDATIPPAGIIAFPSTICAVLIPAFLNCRCSSSSTS